MVHHSFLGNSLAHSSTVLLIGAKLGWKIMGMIGRPDEVYTDPQVVACTHAVLRHHGGGPSMAQPTRAQLLAALAR